MIDPEHFCHKLKENKFGPFIGVPCSVLKSIINVLHSDSDFNYLTATSEGEAIGMAAGSALSSRFPVVMIQNSGLGNAINPLTSLSLVYDLPLLLIISLRGEVGKPDEPQHKVMGRITSDILNVLDIYHEYLMEDDIEEQLRRIKHNVDNNTSCINALIIKKGTFIPYELQDWTVDKNILSRKDAIQCIVNTLDGSEALVSTTGKISRELFFSGKDRKTDFYVVGSMGCASSIALAISLQKPDKKVLVLDGDGAVLMKMGTLATIGHYKPGNLIHIVLDNESYESTGGQNTVSGSVSLEKVAEYSGYGLSLKVNNSEELTKAVKTAIEEKGPTFILVKLAKMSANNIGRPTLTPSQIKKHFMNFLNG